ncbi:hypothetical protein I552_0004 [Mycobacterium xenopi 3993]|nr:hypothetical protein I552_0004 [Mycobacterium xenopi 3993]
MDHRTREGPDQGRGATMTSAARMVFVTITLPVEGTIRRFLVRLPAWCRER